MANVELLAKIASTQPNPDTTLDTAIQRYLNGESMQVLAKEMALSRHTLYKWMMKRKGKAEWHELKKDALIMRICDADEKLENASDPVNIARAREQCRFARMDYERLAPDEYGPKQELEVDNKLTIIVARTPQHIDEQPVTIDGNVQFIDKAE